jgi:hypothetical protein
VNELSSTVRWFAFSGAFIEALPWFFAKTLITFVSSRLPCFLSTATS